MKREQKLEIIDGLAERFSTVDCFYVVDAMSLTVAQINKFRKICAEHKLVYLVAKNRLIQKALEQCGRNDDRYAAFFARVLKGFSGVIFSSESGSAPAKMLKSFWMAEGLTLPALKGASIYGDLFIGAAHLESLSTLKSKDELLGAIMALIKSPMTNVMAAFHSGEQRLMGSIAALSNAST